MKINAYLCFTGNAEEAVKFYQNALGGDADIARFGGSPAAEFVPADWGDKVLHAILRTKGGDIMFSDATPDRAGSPGDNISLSITADDAAETDRIFEKLVAGGKVTMPLDKTFWSPRFGMLVDKYGIAWMVNCAVPEPANV